MSGLPGLLTVRRGVIRLVDDTGELQRVQAEIFGGDVRDRRDRPQPYGFTSSPFAGSEAVALAVGGNPNDTLIICIEDRRYRLSGLASGEVALYDDQGQTVYLTRDGVRVTSTKKVTIETKRAEITATEAVHIGAGGVGPTYRPGQITNYTLGVPTSQQPPREVAQR